MSRSHPSPAHGEPRWSIVIPVKRLDRAKSRLDAGAMRRELALALACDTVDAALGCDRVAAVVVVSDDARAESELSRLGALVVGDAPDAGLNPALRHGAREAAERHPGQAIAAMSADLPALRADELGAVLREAARVRHGFLADAAGTGTTVYAAAPGHRFAPAFGPDSRHRHRELGVVELDPPGAVSVRRDVDTLADLREALALGAGPRTAALAARLPMLAGS